MPLSTVFGTSYTKYGCELVLNPDSTFTLTLGATNNEDSYGTYTQQEDKLLINYANGITDEFAVTKDEQNKLIENSGQLTVSARGINSEALFKSANVTKEDDKLTLHSYNDVDVAVAISPISESDRLKFKSSKKTNSCRKYPLRFFYSIL